MYISNKYKFVIVILLTIFLVTNIFTINSFAQDTDNKADLVIDSSIIPSVIVEDELINISIFVKNIGNKNLTDDNPIQVAIYLDYDFEEIVALNSTYISLEVNEIEEFKLQFTADIGDGNDHIITVVVDYNNQIDEGDEGENNNIADFIARFVSKPTDLEVIEIITPNNIYENNTIQIQAIIKNNGQKSTKLIKTEFSVVQEGLIESAEKDIVLNRGSICNFYYNWTPSTFGTKKIIIEVFHGADSQHFLEKSIVIKVTELEWWDSNWHYRHFITVNGTGVVSQQFNFTEYLDDLNVALKDFENEKIRVIQYDQEGNVYSLIDNYYFNESLNFESSNNATGKLFWSVDDSIDTVEKYFCIYFDVSDNDGTRTIIGENSSLVESGDAYINYQGFIEGWQTQLITPSNASFSLVGDLINITVNTDSIADIVEAFIYLNSNTSHNFTIDLEDSGQGILWKNNSFYFDKQGNWTISINSKDAAGYEPYIIESTFFVGKPDIILQEILFSTDYTTSSTIFFKGDLINITAKLTSTNANIENTSILVEIFKVKNHTEVFNTTIENVTINKNKVNFVSYKWQAEEIDSYIVNISADNQNLTNEKNENNNNLSKEFEVRGIPDLAVTDILMPLKSVTEFEDVKIDAIVKNFGEGPADDYEIRLYVESANANEMYYKEHVDNKTFDISANSTKKVSLYYNNAKPGIWRIGVKIISSNVKKDLNFLNNQATSKDNLTVRGYERNPPNIKSIIISPSYQEQGGLVRITTIITDDTGIGSVSLKIEKPNKQNLSYSMPRTNNQNEFAFTFTDTLEVGLYYVTISATDISVHSNSVIENETFSISKDDTAPQIIYLKASPYVQLLDKEVTIICKAIDNIEIKSVELKIAPPEGMIFVRDMQRTNENRFEYSAEYNITGKYIFSVEIEDKAGNSYTSDESIFWITKNIDDIDNDGIPNWWEEKYNLDPEDETDASIDSDNDGYDNLKEYEIGTNPQKDIFIQNLAYRIKDNVAYMIGSIIMFLIIFSLFLMIRRRD